MKARYDERYNRIVTEGLGSNYFRLKWGALQVPICDSDDMKVAVEQLIRDGVLK